jgi:hypothetical protein
MPLGARPGRGALKEEAMTGNNTGRELRRHRRGPAAACAAATALAAAGAAAAAPAFAADHAAPASRTTAAAPAAGATHPQPRTAGPWRTVKTVTGPGDPYFSAVTAPSSTSAWAFEAVAQGTARPEAWRLSGSTWRREPFPRGGGDIVDLASSTSPSNVWAFTQIQYSPRNHYQSRWRALRWNGSNWATVGSFRRGINGAAVIGPRDVWIFGSPFVPGANLGARHYNGQRWVDVPSGHGLVAGSALSATSVWATGGKQVAHWDGHTWSRTSVAALLPQDTELSHARMTGIYAQSASSVWAVGTGGRQDEGGPALLLHYNGHTWSKVAARSRNYSDPAQVVPDGAGGLWIPVPGSWGFDSRVLHYSGGHLAAVTLPGGPTRINVSAIASSRGGVSFGAGFTHPAGRPDRDRQAVILESR